MLVARRPGMVDLLARLAGRRAGTVAVAAWGFGEAIVLPVVPDVLLYLLAAAAPRRALPLFAWTVAGALAGSLVLGAISQARPDAGRSIVLAVPGVDRPMLAEAEAAVASGDPLSMAHFGPGTPLKVYTVAWWTGPQSAGGHLAGVVANRLERIGPGVVLAALLGSLAPAFIRRRERALLAAYVAAWLVFYALFLGG